MSKEEAWLLDEKYSGKKTDDFLCDCDRLRAGEPLAYIIGHMPFLNTTIYLDSHPLIPRPETEFWVEKAIDEIRNGIHKAPKVLDLCAGSGCIGVAIGSAMPTSSVDFVEIIDRHHETILKNIHVNNINNSRVHVHGGSLFDEVSGTYDFILSNPPYLDPEFCRAQQCVLDYEPHEALFGGNAGVGIITDILQKASRYLKEDGVLYVEHEPDQSAFIKEFSRQLDFSAKTYRDQYHIERFTRITRQDKK